MEVIKTKTFELAAITKGDSSSDRVYIVLPGRLDTKDYANFSSHLDYLANKGFYSIAIDPPGTWDSPGDIELYTTTNYIKAVNELIEHLGDKHYFLLGHSRGGAVATLVALNNPKAEGIIIVMPALGAPLPTDPESKNRGYKISYRDLPPGTSKTVEQKIFNLPIAYFTDGEKYDPASAIKNLTKPKLIIYGDGDQLFKPETIEKIIDKASEPKMVREIHSTHDYRYHPEAILEVNKLIGQFIDKYF